MHMAVKPQSFTVYHDNLNPIMLGLSLRPLKAGKEVPTTPANKGERNDKADENAEGQNALKTKSKETLET